MADLHAGVPSPPKSTPSYIQDDVWGIARISPYDYFVLQQEAKKRMEHYQEALLAAQDVMHQHEGHVHEGLEVLDSSSDIIETTDKGLEAAESVMDKVDRGLASAELGHAGPIMAIITSSIRLLFTPFRCLVERRLPTKQEAVRLGLTTVVLALAIGALLTFATPLVAGILSIVSVAVITARYIQQSKALQHEHLDGLQKKAMRKEKEMEEVLVEMRRLNNAFSTVKEEWKEGKITTIQKPTSEEFDAMQETMRQNRNAYKAAAEKYDHLMDQYTLIGYKIHKERRPIENNNHNMALELHVASNALVIVGSILLLVSLSNPITFALGLGILISGVAMSISTGLFFKIGDHIAHWLHKKSFQKQYQDIKDSPSAAITPNQHPVPTQQGENTARILEELTEGNEKHPPHSTEPLPEESTECTSSQSSSALEMKPVATAEQPHQNTDSQKGEPPIREQDKQHFFVPHPQPDAQEKKEENAEEDEGDGLGR